MINRQFHDERRILFPEGLIDKNAGNAQHNNVQGQNAPGYVNGIFPENGGGNQRQDGEPGGAGNKGNQKQRNHPGLARFDDAGAENSRNVAAETQAHRDETFAVQADQMHDPVHHKGGARHIADIFQQGHDGKKDQQYRQECEHGAGAADDAVEQQPLEPGRPAACGRLRKRQ